MGYKKEVILITLFFPNNVEGKIMKPTSG